MRVKDMGVSYRLIDEKRSILKEYDSYSQDIYWDALRHAGEFKISVTIERVAHWESDGKKGQAVTGEYIVNIPTNLADELRRYNTLNGWRIPGE